MKILLIVIGIILLLIGGFGYLVTYMVIKSQADWDDFYKEVEKENPLISEEALYKLVYKMNLWSSIGLILGILLLIGGFGYLVTYMVIKSQVDWDDFYKEVEKENPLISEEALYKLVSKMNLWSSIGLILGILLLIGGIILQIMFK